MFLYLLSIIAQSITIIILIFSVLENYIIGVIISLVVIIFNGWYIYTKYNEGRRTFKVILFVLIGVTYVLSVGFIINYFEEKNYRNYEIQLSSLDYQMENIINDCKELRKMVETQEEIEKYTEFRDIVFKIQSDISVSSFTNYKIKNIDDFYGDKFRGQINKLLIILRNSNSSSKLYKGMSKLIGDLSIIQKNMAKYL